MTSARRSQITMLDHEGIELADTAERGSGGGTTRARDRKWGSVNKASLPQSPSPVVGMPRLGCHRAVRRRSRKQG